MSVSDVRATTVLSTLGLERMNHWMNETKLEIETYVLRGTGVTFPELFLSNMTSTWYLFPLIQVRQLVGGIGKIIGVCLVKAGFLSSLMGFRSFRWMRGQTSTFSGRNYLPLLRVMHPPVGAKGSLARKQQPSPSSRGER